MAAEAARSKGSERAEPQADPALPVKPAIPSVQLDEPQRPALAPEPALNQNDPLVTDRPRSATRRPPRAVRLVARVLIAPLYIFIAIASAAILVLAAKYFLGL
jgi:hypothetical protein